MAEERKGAKIKMHGRLPERPLSPLYEELEAHGGSRLAIREVTRDMSEAYALGAADAFPEAIQTVDRFHVSQLFSRATDKVRCREARLSEEKRSLLRGTKYCWLKRPGAP